MVKLPLVIKMAAEVDIETALEPPTTILPPTTEIELAFEMLIPPISVQTTFPAETVMLETPSMVEGAVAAALKSPPATVTRAALCRFRLDEERSEMEPPVTLMLEASSEVAVVISCS